MPKAEGHNLYGSSDEYRGNCLDYGQLQKKMKQKCDIGGQISNQIDHNKFLYFESGYIKVSETSTGIRTKNMNMCKIQCFNHFFHYIFAIYLLIIHFILHTGIIENPKFSYGYLWRA